MCEQSSDWRDVIGLRPHGYVEINDGKVVHGPLASIALNEAGFVVITLKWSAMLPWKDGYPTVQRWTAARNVPFMFPNRSMPYVIEDTPDQGRRVRFESHFIYLECAGNIMPDQVAGLTLDKNGFQIKPE